MVRFTALIFSFVIIPQVLRAETPAGTDPRIATALAIQTAMTKANEHLQAGRPGEAVAVLEAEILHVNGNSSFLVLMKQAYAAHLKELKRTGADPDRIDHVCRQLRILDPKLNLDEIAVAAAGAIAKPTPIVAAITKPMPAPVSDDPPPAVGDKLPPAAVGDKPAPAVVQAKSEVDDPFQQTPKDRMPGGSDARKQARAQFEQKHFAEASALFAQAHQAGAALSAEEKQAWGYCRLSVVVKRLGDASAGKAALPALEKEAAEATRLGGPTLESFGQQVLAEINRRQGKPATTAVPEGWQAIEMGNFRVFYRQSRQQAEQMGKAAEGLRKSSYDKWVGPSGGDWSPRCDLWLHATAADYAKSTGKPADSPGYSRVGIRDGKVALRRIDLRLDDAGMTEISLPREVTYVVLCDLFPQQPLPRWADVGMSILSQPQGEISRYRRAVAKLASEKKLFAVRELLRMAEFPEAEKITPFYVESVSLVDFLVRLKGPKAFALYLREAPRRGYEEALQRHYGFKDANELQENWFNFAMKGE